MQVIKEIWSIITTLLLILLILLAGLLMGVRLFGLQVFTVMSDTMAPGYPVGSLIYVQKTEDPAQIPEGTIITFQRPEEPVTTSRILEAVPGEDGQMRYRTRGDALEEPDPGLVHYKEVVGKTAFVIPELGRLYAFLQTPLGKFSAVFSNLLLVILTFLQELVFPVRRKKKKRSKAPKKAQLPENRPPEKKPAPARKKPRPQNPPEG